MRLEHAPAKRGSKTGLVSAGVGLALVAGTLLATGGAPAEHPTSLAASARLEAASSPASDRITPRDAIADRDHLDLQLD